jgi:hypothetical protein
MLSNVDKSKVVRISKATISSTDYDRSDTTEVFEIFPLNGYYDKNNARYKCEIKYRSAMAKAAFIKRKAAFTSKLDLNVRKTLKK